MELDRIFQDRGEAGRVLADRLRKYADREDVIVLALPRGGVPVGYEVAKALNVPLDLLMVRKLGLPGQEELAMGAIASGGVCILNDEVIKMTGVPKEVIERVANDEKNELERRELEYRGNRPPPEVEGRTVILVDDGVATGSTIRAGVEALRTRRPARIVVAVPTASPAACESLALIADEVVCVAQPDPFMAISLSYVEFPQLSDDDVRDILRRAARK